MNRKRIISVRSETQANPLAAVLMLLSTLSGLALIFGVSRPSSITTLLPWWAATLWAWVIALSGLAALIGMWWQPRVTGLLIEKTAVLVAGIGAFYYAVVTLFYAGQLAIFPAGMILAFSAACCARTVQISRFLKAVEREVNQESK